MVQVINNFLNNEKFYSIYKTITDVNFPWYLQQPIVFSGESEKQFTHNLVSRQEESGNEKNQTSFWVTPILSPLLQQLAKVNEKKISDTDVIRAKLSLTHRTHKTIETKPHTDVSKINLNEISETAMLYMNTNNGYTKIVGGEKIESVQNRLLIFPTDTSHFEATNTDIDHRIVLKLVYKI